MIQINMDMPTSCAECHIRPKGCANNIHLHSRPKDCPLKEVPSGKWIYDGHHLRCSNCNDYHTIKDSDWNLIASNYCPNCGAKMEQGENT